MANWLAHTLLRILHIVYYLYANFLGSSRRHHKQHPLRGEPKPLSATRSRLPRHLALVLGYSTANSSDDSCLKLDKKLKTREQQCSESAKSAIKWCREAGIEELTLYDPDGIISRTEQELQEYINAQLEAALPLKTHASDEEDSEELQYPLTPPMSEHSDSCLLSPELNTVGLDLSVATMFLDPSARRRRKREAVQKTKKKNVMTRRRVTTKATSQESLRPLTLHVLSRESSKPALASLATALAHNNEDTLLRHVDPRASNSRLAFASIEDIDRVLTGDQGFSAPDLMIVHPLDHAEMPLELYGFPPWQIRLTEIYHNKRPASCEGSLREIDLRKALDEYATVEMRFGK